MDIFDSVCYLQFEIYTRLSIIRTFTNSNLALTRAKVDFPYISFIHLL